MEDKTLFTKNQILHMIRKMARQADQDYFGKGLVHVICILKSGVPFATEFVKHIDFPVIMHYVGIDEKGKNFKYWPKEDFSGKNVLIFDAIIKTGGTMAKVLQRLAKDSDDYTVRIATLLKSKGAKCWSNYVGQTIDNQMNTYGFGMNCEEQLNRNLTEVKIKL